MKLKKILALLLSASLVLQPTLALAEDIDLYTGGEQFTGAPSNVLIVLDNTTNWAANSQHWAEGKQGISELETLSEIAGSLTDNVNVGLMMYGADQGGQVRYHIREMNATNRSRFQQIMSYMAANAVGGSDVDEVPASASYDDLMNSAFRYFIGQERWKDSPAASAADDRRDFTDNTATAVYDPDPNPSGYTWGYQSRAAANYNAPADGAAGCAKNFIIFIGNGFPSAVSEASELTAAGALISKVPDITEVVAMSPKNPWADEWARFMYQYGVPTDIDDPQNPGQKIHNKITTYTIDVCKDACEDSQETLLRSMAKVGGGKYYRSTSKSEIKNALNQIFAEIQAVNSVFASATLPVSVNTQGTYENQVYIGVFRPDGASRPRWYGNLKGYKIARYCDANSNDKVDNIGADGDERIDGNGTPPTCTGDTLKLYLADRNNTPAIDQTMQTGFMGVNTTSYWTQASTFWAFNQDAVAGSSDSPDGPNVERGGAAYRLRATFPTSTEIANRKVYTCLGTCLADGASEADRTLSAHPFKTSNTNVTTQLANNWPMTINLSRVGNTVTGTTAAAHGLSAGQTITISGTGSTVYNATHTLVSGSGTTLTFNVVEKPLNDLIGTTQVSVGASSVNVTNISINTLATVATVTTSAAHPFVNGDSITIGGAAQSFLNGTFTPITKTGANSFTFPLAWSAPATPATAAGSTTWGTPVGTSGVNTALSRPDAAQPAVVLGAWNDIVPVTGSPKLTVGVSQLTVSGADTGYNGTFTLKEQGSSCPGTSAMSAAQKKKAYCYSLVGAENGAGMTATKSGGTLTTATITRVGTTATATVAAAIPAATTSVFISGSSQSEYNGTKTVVTAADGLTFTFTVTVTPPATASGTATVAGAPAVTANNLINWMRGVDNAEDENANTSYADVRASIHGDVLHSRPLLINYGSATGIVGFYGSNDGYLRAIKAGIADTDGVEKWAFIPDEFVNLNKLGRLYANGENIRFPNSMCPAGGATAPSPRNYFWDGQLSAYQSEDLATTYLFAGMRRGGRSLYALNISDPDAPKLMWRISNATTGFSQLGQTWSEPMVAWIKDVTVADTEKRLVLIFGAGYDPTDDDQKPGAVRGDRGGYSGIGRGVFVVDALTGALVKFLASPADRDYSFAADVTPFDSDGDGLVDRIYAVDTGAQLFRFDAVVTVDPSTDAGWTSYHLAKFGDTNGDGGSDARKFLFPPAVVPFTYTRTNGDKVSAMMLLVGSGDREKPLPNKKRNGDANALSCPALYSDTYFGDRVEDRFYGLVDKVAANGAAESTVATESDMFLINADPDSLTQYSLCLAFDTNCDPAPAPANLIKRGWMVKMVNDPDGAGYGEEKLVNSPRVVSGLALFGTNAPQTPDTSRGVCSNLGQAYTYALSPFTGMPSFDRNNDGEIDQSDFASSVTGGGLPPSVTAGVVGISDGGSTSFHRYIIGGGGEGVLSGGPTEATKNPITVRGDRTRVYWHYPLDTK